MVDEQVVGQPDAEPAGRTCPRPGCAKVMGAGVYACGPHWYELPPDIRGAISQAWWAFRRTGDPDRLERHRKACERAEQWWDVNVVTPQGKLL